jgi:hypothetical protein
MSSAAVRPASAWLAGMLLAATPTAYSQTVKYYEAQYQAEVRPAAGVIHVELQLAGERLPSKVVLHIDGQRHRSFTSKDPLEIAQSKSRSRP